MPIDFCNKQRRAGLPLERSIPADGGRNLLLVHPTHDLDEEGRGGGPLCHLAVAPALLCPADAVLAASIQFAKNRLRDHMARGPEDQEKDLPTPRPSIRPPRF